MPRFPDTDGSDGCQRWRGEIAGPWFREDGPSFVGCPFGQGSFFRYVWTNSAGQRHRENGPVEARSDGMCMWAKDGEEQKIGGDSEDKWLEMEDV